MLAQFFTGIVAGFIAHQTRPFLVKKFGNGYLQLVSYGVGLLIIFPISYHIFKKMKSIEDDERFTVAFWGGAIPVGIGVGFGWAFDKPETKDR